MMYNTVHKTRKERVSKKYPKTTDEITVANIVLRKDTESNNVLRKIRIKKELKDLVNLSTQGLKHDAFGYYSKNILVN